MGEVFNAINSETNSDVILTLIHPAEQLADRHRLQALEVAQTLRALDHPGVLPIHDAQLVANGRMAVINATLDAKVLGTEVGRGRVFSAARTIPILRQACAILRATHAAGVYHGALSVGSVLLSARRGRRDFVTLTDFGLHDVVDAMLLVPDADAAYQPSSPERSLGQPRVAAEDIYLLGSIGYTMLTGGPPFRTGNVEAIEQRHAIEDPMPIERRIPSDLPPTGLIQVIHRCLKKAPSDRYEDLADLEAALCSAQLEAGIRTPWDDLPIPPVAPARQAALEVAFDGFGPPASGPHSTRHVESDDSIPIDLGMLRRTRRSTGPGSPPPRLPEAFPVHAASPPEDTTIPPLSSDVGAPDPVPRTPTEEQPAITGKFITDRVPDEPNAAHPHVIPPPPSFHPNEGIDPSPIAGTHLADSGALEHGRSETTNIASTPTSTVDTKSISGLRAMFQSPPPPPQGAVELRSTNETDDSDVLEISASSLEPLDDADLPDNVAELSSSTLESVQGTDLPAHPADISGAFPTSSRESEPKANLEPVHLRARRPTQPPSPPSAGQLEAIRRRRTTSPQILPLPKPSLLQSSDSLVSVPRPSMDDVDGPDPTPMPAVPSLTAVALHSEISGSQPIAPAAIPTNERKWPLYIGLVATGAALSLGAILILSRTNQRSQQLDPLTAWVSLREPSPRSPLSLSPALAPLKVSTPTEDVEDDPPPKTDTTRTKPKPSDASSNTNKAPPSRPKPSGPSASQLASQGNAAFNAGAYAKAARLLSSAVRKQPNNAAYRISLGDAYYKQGNTAAARRHYSKAQSLGHPSAARRLAKVGG